MKNYYVQPLAMICAFMISCAVSIIITIKNPVQPPLHTHAHSLVVLWTVSHRSVERVSHLHLGHLLHHPLQKLLMSIAFNKQTTWGRDGMQYDMVKERGESGGQWGRKGKVQKLQCGEEPFTAACMHSGKLLSQARSSKIHTRTCCNTVFSFVEEHGLGALHNGGECVVSTAKTKHWLVLYSTIEGGY